MKKNIKIGLVIAFCLIVTSANLIYFCLYHNKSDTLESSSLEIRGKLVIDTDAGGDDAGAILLALWAQEKIKGFEVIAVTCTYGNTNATNVATNVLKILTIASRSDIPVYVGAHKSLLRSYKSANYFGEDGMGDFDFGEEIIGEIDRSKHASVALVDLAHQHAGNVSIVALGPLTNIAIAITLDPNFAHNIDRLYIMGASVHGVGNVAPNVEANFQHDPHSNFIVLNNTGGHRAVLLPWETAVAAAIPTKWRTDVLGILDSRRMKFWNQAEATAITHPTWSAADVMAIALMVRPELITRTLVANVIPVFDGAAEGSVLVDYGNLTGEPHNVEILEAFDVEGFKKLLLDAFA